MSSFAFWFPESLSSPAACWRSARGRESNAHWADVVPAFNLQHPGTPDGMKKRKGELFVTPFSQPPVDQQLPRHHHNARYSANELRRVRASKRAPSSTASRKEEPRKSAPPKSTERRSAHSRTAASRRLVRSRVAILNPRQLSTAGCAAYPAPFDSSLSEGKHFAKSPIVSSATSHPLAWLPRRAAPSGPGQVLQEPPRQPDLPRIPAAEPHPQEWPHRDQPTRDHGEDDLYHVSALVRRCALALPPSHAGRLQSCRQLCISPEQTGVHDHKRATH